jgi:MoxR-like ATPase
MIKRVISTNLLKKEETFRVMALGEALRTPILLIGPPGVAKTAAVIDFAKSSLGNLGSSDLFLLETDEGTRSNAVKGNIDLEALTTTNKYKINSPITSAKVVVINEIDKASASLRNSLLGIMNERVLFNGTEKIPCAWTNFIATCNEIPDDEVDSPFWDRFLITHEVTRLSQAEMLGYYAKGGKSFVQTQDIQLPDLSDIDAIKLNPDKLKKVLDVAHDELSDRALSFLPTLVKNVMIVWGMNEDRGIVKTAELLIGKSHAKELAKTLVPKEVRDLYDLVDAIGQCMTTAEYNSNYDKLEIAFGEANKAGHVTKQDESDLQVRIEEEEAKLSFLKSSDDEKVFDNL